MVGFARSDRGGQAAIVPSRRLRRLPNLAAFLPEFDQVVARPGRQRVGGVIAWGRKASAARAARVAETLDAPLMTLEDGFLRSLEPDDPPLSVVVDRRGIHTDTVSPSDLDHLLSTPGWETADLLERADRGLRDVRDYGLSKYNAAPPTSAQLDRLVRGGRRLVLVVDQIAGDSSIRGAGACTVTFRTMLETALADEPDATVVVKGHPVSGLGARRGQLTGVAPDGRWQVLDEAIEPRALLSRVAVVYTVSSQFGLDALIAGVPVRCFGRPFYAGLGLTRDDGAARRPSRRRSLSELFAAAFLLYARYADPCNGRPTTLENTIDLLFDLKTRRAKGVGRAALVGFSLRKCRFVPPFLATTDTPSRPTFASAGAIRRATRAGRRPVIWGARHADRIARAGVAASRMEDGFIRSQGLGSKLSRPWSLVIDHLGLYYDPRTPNDLEVLLNTYTFPEGLVERARRLRLALTRHRLSKYNLVRTGRPAVEIPAGTRRVILVPGQVEDDASLRFGSPRLASNLALLRAVRARAADAFIVYRPHPDVAHSGRSGAIPRAAVLDVADAIDETADITDLITLADEVHVMTSLTGFEALLRGKRVVTHGQPFYAGWGLTLDLDPPPRRWRALVVDELAAAALILYPLYLDPLSRLPCRPETLIERLVAGGQGAREPLAFFRQLPTPAGGRP